MSETSRHESWRNEYRVFRYLEHLTIDELESRYADLLRNLVTITSKGQLGAVPVTDSNSAWMEKITHVQEEYSLRKIPFSHLPLKGIPYPSWKLMPAAVRATQRCAALGDSILVKYQKAAFLRGTLATGKLLLRAASFYSDDSLNQAQRDNEIERSIEAHPGVIRMELRDRRTGDSKGMIKPVGNVKFSVSTSTDYYVYFMSETLEPRLFCDFDADACLIISNPRVFIDRLQSALAGRLPAWVCSTFPVRYFDPLMSTSEIGVCESKHFGFSYQQEIRTVWIPPAPMTKLPAIDVEIGSLSDIAELIELESANDRPE